MNAKPPRILFLDDQPEWRDALAIFIPIILPSATVRACGDGLSAWRMIEQETPDLLISDVNHPGLSIHDLISQTSFPVIITTGMTVGISDFPPDRVQILYKPVELSELKQAINRALNQP